jgi:hypothetical protein
MTKKYRIDVTDVEFSALQWKFADPHQAIDDFVTERIRLSMDEIATREIQRRLNDPTWTKPIPADKMEVFNDLILKSAKQIRDEDTIRMVKMVANPDDPEGLLYPEPTIPKP